VVGRIADSNFPRTFYVSGEMVGESGIYRVHHAPHRLSHAVTLLKGNLFPICAGCADAVHFELLRAAPAAVDDATFRFRIQLYALPVLSDEDEDAAAAAKAG